jgi:toxin ParE1/3/4
MAFQVVWTAPVSNSLEAIRTYIAQDNPKAADRVVDAIVQQADLLEAVPRLGPRYPCRSPGEIRQTISGKYRIFYEVFESEERVEILTVWHGARREPRL